jgi:hypothetical protein
MLLFLVRMQCGRTIGRMLCKLYNGRMWDHIDVRYFLEYPLGNTWTYETHFGPLCNSTEHTFGLPNVCYFLRELVANFPYKYPPPPLIPHDHFHPPVRP